MGQKKTSLSKKFSKRLKKLRDGREWSQGQVALKLKVDPQRISKYERDISFPTVDMLIKLATIFDVSIDYLLLDELEEDLDKRDYYVRDRELVEYFKLIDKLPKDEQTALKLILKAFLRTNNLID